MTFYMYLSSRVNNKAADDLATQSQEPRVSTDIVGIDLVYKEYFVAYMWTPPSAQLP